MSGDSKKVLMFFLIDRKQCQFFIATYDFILNVFKVNRLPTEDRVIGIISKRFGRVFVSKCVLI